jgi:rubredoxin
MRFMSNLLDLLPMEITCPKCGNKVKETIGWFKTDNSSCPFCNLSFNPTEFERRLTEAKSAID